MPYSLLSCLLAAVAVIGSNSLVLSPISGSVALSFSGSDAADVMIAAACYGLGTAASALTLAPRIDRIGPGRALVQAMTGLAFALAVSAWAPTLWLLCAAQAFAGIAAGLALPATYALATQIAPKGRESEAMGLVITGWTVSLVLGVSLSALVAEIAHWRGVFIGLAVLAGLIVIVLRLAVSMAPPSELPQQKSTPLTALRVPGMARALLVCASYMAAFYALYSYIGPHAQIVLNQPVAAVGLLSLAYGVGFGAAVPLDRIIDRRGPERVAVSIFCLLAATYLAMSLTVWSMPVLIGLCVLWGVANHLGLNLILGRLGHLDPRQNGSIMGLYSATCYLSLFLGTLAYRPLFDAFGFTACALASALCVGLAILDSARARSANLHTDKLGNGHQQPE
ncbi:MAG: MFS transporter [Alphaproteobacteria bacterium]|nr:MFS transporter [Alphaproteobacteria bacterium]